MADTFQFDLVSPERRLASFAATEVSIPGAEGDMTAMADHAPTITTLRPGVLSVKGVDGDQAYFVTGGFAEIGAGSISVLAEQSFAQSDLTQDDLQAIVNDAKATVAAATGDAADLAAKQVADIVAAGSQLGLSVSA